MKAPRRFTMCAAVLAGLGAGLFPAETLAQGEEVCEPATESGAAQVADRFALDPEQRTWLVAGIGDGRVKQGDDLDGLPGAGAELLEEIAASICWETSMDVSVVTSIRMRGGDRQTETRLEAGRGGARGWLRLRSDRGARPRWRGAVRWERFGWSMTAGTIKTRLGLGLLVSTVGASPRGHRPLAAARSGWFVDRGLDARTPRGGAVVYTSGAWTVEGAALEPGGKGSPPTFGLTAFSRRWEWGTASVAALHGRQEDGWTVTMGAAKGSYDTAASGESFDWTIETARAHESGATGLSAGFRRSIVRLGASLVHADAGFDSPMGWSPPRSSLGETVILRLEGRLKSSPTGSLRFSVEEEQEAGREQWSRGTQRWELETLQRPGRGMSLGVLWRTWTRRDLGALEPETGESLLRLDVSRRVRRWEVRGRVERRASGLPSARLLSCRFGRDGTLAWRVRAAWVSRDDGSPSLWWYARRAGSAYGWSRLNGGFHPGLWVRWTRGAAALEASMDRIQERWDGVLALRWNRN